MNLFVHIYSYVHTIFTYYTILYYPVIKSKRKVKDDIDEL